MSLIILQVEGQPFVQAVKLDYGIDGEVYAAEVKKYIDQAAVLRYVEVDVSSLAEYGPDDIAMLLSEDTQAEFGVTDLPQRWEIA